MIDMSGFDTTRRVETRFPAVRLTRGGCTLYQLALGVTDFASVVPGVPSRYASAARGGYDESHARTIARFMVENPEWWAFGAISLALAARQMDFAAFPGTENGVQFGTLSLKPTARGCLIILDGQHRRRAIQIVHKQELPGRNIDWALVQSVLAESDLSVDLYAIDDLADVRRVFGWMNTVRRP